MVRLDMSEYMEKHTVSRLIGAPPGYIGYEEGGQLTEPVRRRPYSVILFDEVEKAHPDVYNVLLQVLDDGRLTDGQGRTVDFKNTVIILTSNTGSQHIAAIDERDLPEEDKQELIKRAVMEDVRKAFRPEFLNRLDETVVFHRLSRDSIHAIIDIQLRRFAERIEKREIFVDLTPAAKDFLAEVGWDPQYGASASAGEGESAVAVSSVGAGCGFSAPSPCASRGVRRRCHTRYAARSAARRTPAMTGARVTRSKTPLFVPVLSRRRS